MTNGDKGIAALARGFFNYLTAMTPIATTVVTAKTAELAKFLGDTVDKNFPSQGLAERSLKGPIVALLHNSEKDIAAFLATNILGVLTTTKTSLDTRAKAAGV